MLKAWYRRFENFIVDKRAYHYDNGNMNRYGVYEYIASWMGRDSLYDSRNQ